MLDVDILISAHLCRKSFVTSWVFPDNKHRQTTKTQRSFGSLGLSNKLNSVC